MRVMTLKRIFVLSMSAVMAFGLSACDSDSISTDDAAQCVRVELDTTYKGQFDGFLDFYGNVTQQDAQNQYDENVEGEAGFFLDGMGTPSLEDEDVTQEPSEAQYQRAKELYQRIYAQSDYAVVSSSKQDDGTFAVKLVIRPLDIFDLVNDNYDDGFDAFWTEIDGMDFDAMSSDEFSDWYLAVYVPRYYDTLLDLLESQIPNMGYKAEKNIVIQVEQDEEGALMIPTEDLQNLDRLIIDYTLS